MCITLERSSRGMALPRNYSSQADIFHLGLIQPQNIHKGVQKQSGQTSETSIYTEDRPFHLIAKFPFTKNNSLNICFDELWKDTVHEKCVFLSTLTYLVSNFTLYHMECGKVTGPDSFSSGLENCLVGKYKTPSSSDWCGRAELPSQHWQCCSLPSQGWAGRRRLCGQGITD